MGLIVGTPSTVRRLRFTGPVSLLPTKNSATGALLASLTLLKARIKASVQSKVTAGGAGSGCHGDNCGRPTTSLKLSTTFKESGRQDRLSVEFFDGSTSVGHVDLLTDIGPGIAQTEDLEIWKEHRGVGFAVAGYEALMQNLSEKGYTELRSSEMLQKGGVAVWEALKRKYPEMISLQGEYYSAKLGSGKDKVTALEKPVGLQAYAKMVAPMSAKFKLIEDHGKAYTERVPLKGKLGVPKQCYMNAFRYARDHDLTYVEGLATAKDLDGMPLEHAWVEDKEGRVIDPTWKDGTSYFGIPFKTDYVHKVALRTKVYGVLSHTNMPLLKGEDKEFLAGGAGSGCHGDNCGRPSTGGTGRVEYKLPLGTPQVLAKFLPIHPTWERHKNWRQQAYGAVLVSSRGNFLLREPTGHFDGYAWTFPKGKMDNKKESPVDVAHREVEQETGISGRILSALPGNYKSGSGSNSNYYVMRAKSFDHSKMDRETQDLRWVSYDEAKRLIGLSKNKEGRARDLEILDAAQKYIQRYKIKGMQASALRCRTCGGEIFAGGPGSGCHGDNCGRPLGSGKPGDSGGSAPATKSTAAGVLKEAGGWKKVHKTTLPHWSKGSGAHTATIYQHPKHGALVVNHSGGFQHQPHGTVPSKQYAPLGKNAANLKSYAKALNAPAVSAPVDKQPPDGMPVSFKSIKTQNTYTWDGSNYTKTDGPTHSSVPVSVELASKKLAGGQFVPVVDIPRKSAPVTPEVKKSGPPAGMPTRVTSIYNKKSYKWNDEKGAYVRTGKQYWLFSPKDVFEKLQNGSFKPTAGKFEVAKVKVDSLAGLREVHNIPKIPKIQTPPSVPTAKASPAVSTTTIPGSMAIKPEHFTFKADGKSLGGAHDKYIYSDKNGNDWMFKPATTIGGTPTPLMGHADELVSRVAQSIRPGYAIESKAITMNVPGKGEVFGSLQKMIPADKLRGEGGKFKDFVGRDLNASPLQSWEVKHLQQEQVLDWLISNHDAHGGQFLRTSGQYVGSRSVIGIDKTQAFKFFPNDKLSTDYKPNTESHGEKQPFYNDMWASVKAGKINFDPQDALETIKRAEGISREDYRKMLEPYVNARFMNVSEGAKFVSSAIERKENLRSDFEKFYSQILGKKFEFEPVEEKVKIDENAVGVVNKPKKADKLPDNEVRPNGAITIKGLLPSLLEKYPEINKHKEAYGKIPLAQLTEGTIALWQQQFNKSDPFLPEQERYVAAAKGAGLYAELAAQVGLMPTDLTSLSKAIYKWRSSSGSDGASHIRAASQDVISTPQTEQLKSRMSAAMQVEYEITQAKLAKLYPSGVMPLYRGLSGAVADDLAAKKAAGYGVIEYHTMGAEGWSDALGTAKSFEGGVILNVPNMPIQHVVHSYKASPGIATNHTGETETFVAVPQKKLYLKNKEIMVKNQKTYEWSSSAAKGYMTKEEILANANKIGIVDGTKNYDENCNLLPIAKRGSTQVFEMEVMSPEEVAALGLK